MDLRTFLGFSRDMAALNFSKTGNAVYLHIKSTKTKVMS